MIDIVKLRERIEALDKLHRLGSSDYLSEGTLILAAARELLTIREAGALIITPDENGEWPSWARVALLETLDGDWVLDDLLLALKEASDALRDAMPPEGSQ